MQAGNEPTNPTAGRMRWYLAAAAVGTLVAGLVVLGLYRGREAGPSPHATEQQYIEAVASGDCVGEMQLLSNGAKRGAPMEKLIADCQEHLNEIPLADQQMLRSVTVSDITTIDQGTDDGLEWVTVSCTVTRGTDGRVIQRTDRLVKEDGRWKVDKVSPTGA